MDHRGRRPKNPLRAENRATVVNSQASGGSGRRFGAIVQGQQLPVALVIGSVLAALAAAGLAAIGPWFWHRYLRPQPVIDLRWPTDTKTPLSEKIEIDMRAWVLSRSATTSSISTETSNAAEKPALRPTTPGDTATAPVPQPRPRPNRSGRPF